MGKGGSGKGSFAWDWMPQMPWGMPWGKGFGKGKGKGKGNDIVTRVPPDHKVWVGGLPADSATRDMNKKLQEHMSQAGTCKFARYGAKGEGVAVFSSAEEATAAIAALNGSVFEGSVIEVDTWNKKER
eukprot:TRINITY_DN1090_c0_g1_i1.p1 TRINITY_DN1090_c0_g1~~TRINITY_DN1090_c0_g1_i1.p1  ORF type:complete len:128 (-),score=42.59 TRINITY_DN1090_c0_g1_i1:371-754(-)